jgi:putative ABC transport system permease protein
MPILELLRQFRHDMRTQRLRTILTVMGIAWGTVAVVVLLAFGTGLSRQMKTNALGLGDGIVIMSGGRTTRAFEGFPEGRPIRLTEADAEILRREIPTLTEISPEYGQSTRVSNGPTGANPYVTGIIPEYADMRNIHVRGGGRFINASTSPSGAGSPCWATGSTRSSSRARTPSAGKCGSGKCRSSSSA